MDDNFVKDVGALARLEIKKVNFPQAGIIVSTERLADGFVDVQPVVSKLGNDLTKSDYAVLRDVPIVFPSTARTSIQFPVEQGDGVLLFFTQHDSTNYVNGTKDLHLPLMFSFAGLHHAVAYVGFNPYLESVHNANNYSTAFDGQSVNIVHNKKTEKEVKISLNPDGSMTLYSPSTVNVQAKDVISNSETVSVTANTVDVKCETLTADCATLDAKAAIVKTDGDVVVKGLSLYDNATQHDHNYTDDGNPMVTAPPNTV